MKLSGWGRFPVADVKYRKLSSVNNFTLTIDSGSSFIARGMGRSYGDSALADQVLSTQSLDHFIHFNSESGVLECEAGITLDQILKLVVPQGWFLPVTPGTKFVSVGGAIASDVHGKNHHYHGTFSRFVKSFALLTADAERLNVTDSDSELFKATCGGMGLTGLILKATIQLVPIETAYISQTTLRSKSLEETLELFEKHSDSTYSVAWIDCLAKGSSLGRSLIMLGEHLKLNDAHAQSIQPDVFKVHADPKLTVPFVTPGVLVNPWSMKLFNELYYHKPTKLGLSQIVHYDPYFYPLDAINNWNRLYGKEGFVQYQFVVPKSVGVVGLRKVIRAISDSKRGSFLAVLKEFGEANENYLSFPMTGYTLALDFKVEEGLWPLLESLDQMVVELGGRTYLAKDSRMNADTFHKMYAEGIEQIKSVLPEQTNFRSHQSIRLGIQTKCQ